MIDQPVKAAPPVLCKKRMIGAITIVMFASIVWADEIDTPFAPAQRWFTSRNVLPSNDDKKPSQRKNSIEKKIKIHRLSTTKRTAYDAFVYVNRIPEKPLKGESAIGVAGRIFGRLANQEGRILVKLPPPMDRDSYLAFKTFLRYEGKAKVGNCAACHGPAEFTDLKSHVVTKCGSPKPTPSLRNLKKRKVDIRKAIMAKIAASKQKRSHKADEIDDAYAKINISKKDIPGLVKFLNLLNDVSDSDFRKLILEAKLLDTSKDIE